MKKLEFTDLKKEMRVIDKNGNIGIIKNIKNIHNIIVEYNTGVKGYGFYCLDSKDKSHYDALYKYENEPI